MKIYSTHRNPIFWIGTIKIDLRETDEGNPKEVGDKIAKKLLEDMPKFIFEVKNEESQEQDQTEETASTEENTPQNALNNIL